MLNLVPIRRGWYTAIKESFLFRALCCFDWPLSQFCVICSIWSYTEENGLLPLKNLWTSGLSSALVVPCLHAPFWGASPKRVSIRVDLCVILYSFVHPSPLDQRLGLASKGPAQGSLGLFRVWPRPLWDLLMPFMSLVRPLMGLLQLCILRTGSGLPWTSSGVQEFNKLKHLSRLFRPLRNGLGLGSR